MAKQLKGGPDHRRTGRAKDVDIDRAWEALKDAERPRIHTFIATSEIHIKYKLKSTQEEVLEATVAAVKRAKGYTEDVEFSAEDAHRTDQDYPVPGGGGGDQGRRHHDQHPGHGGLRPALGVRRADPQPDEPGARHRAGGGERPLPQRSRPGGGQLAGGHPGRRPAGGVHHQRHRRAGGQRLAGRAGDGAPHAEGLLRLRHRRSTRRRSTAPPSCCSPSPASTSSPTRPSSAPTPSRTRRASTSTASCRRR